MTLWNHGEAPARAAFTCPTCGTVSRDPNDLRFGYCGHCHEFTGEPTDFVFIGAEGFAERVREWMEHHWKPEPIPVMSDEEWQRLHEENLNTFRAEQRMALTLIRPTPRPAVRHEQFEQFRHRAEVDPLVRAARYWADVKWTVWQQWIWRWERARYRGKRADRGQ